LDEFSFALPALPPFRLDLTAWALRRRPDNRIDLWDGQVYRRVLPLGPQNEPIEVAVRQDQRGSANQPELRVTLSGGGARRAIAPAAQAALERVLGLDVDLSGFYRLAEGDAILAPLARRYRGLKPPRFPSVFEALANAIACQQVTLTLGLSLLNRLAEIYGRACLDPAAGENGGIAPRAFPVPEELAGIPPEALRPLGFSHQKAQYLIDLAGAVADGKLDLEALAALDNEEAVARLRELRGVGRWSAEYVLLRGLRRLDVFPGDDVGGRNNLQRWLGLPGKLDYEGVQRVTARWQPYSGLVYLHLLLDSLEKRGVIRETKLAPEPRPEAPLEGPGDA
jgi:DNA-3-methyladenine glycosylase II